MSDAATVQLLWDLFSTGRIGDPGDPGTWRLHGRLLTLAELRRVRGATVADWDALRALQELEGEALAAERRQLLTRLARLRDSDSGQA